MESERKNILYGEIKVKDKKGIKTIKEAVFREDATHYKKMEIVEVVSFKIVGQTHINNGYSEAKANQLSKRDKLGGYE